MKISKGSIILGGALLVFLPTANTQIVLNGDFELPVIPSNTIAGGNVNNWTGLVSLYNGNGGSASFPLPQSGSQYVDIGVSGFPDLTQSVSVPTGANYSLSWYANTSASNPATSGYTVSILDPNSSTVASGTFNANNGGVWKFETLGVSLNSGVNYRVGFSAPGLGDVFVDNVSLVVSPIPEPMAYSTGCGAALLCFGLWRHLRLRRRR